MLRAPSAPVLASLLASILALSESASGQCLNWSDAFHARDPETDHSYTTLALYDDGNGPALYAGGSIQDSQLNWTGFVRRWNGTSWSDIGFAPVGSTVQAMAVFDDGGGSALYVGGGFESIGGTPVANLARWRSGSWSAVGSGVGVAGDGSSVVNSLAVLDDGGGPALFVGGVFTTAGGVAANNIVRWNGSTWTPLGSGVGPFVLALAMVDHGQGPMLYAGGYFTTAGGPANRIARWDGSVWSPLGSGLNGSVLSLAAYDDGSGPALYAGGAFSAAGGLAANRIAKWDGTNWSSVGGGMDATVHSLAVGTEAGGSVLYAGGTFATAGPSFARRIARWNGSTWSTLGNGMGGGVQALVASSSGGGVELHAAGSFHWAGTVEARNVARWDGSAWAAVEAPDPGMGMNDTVRAFAVFDDGGGSALYAGGDFTTAGSAAALKVAKWDGATWTRLGSGIGDYYGSTQSVRALAVYADGGGPALYAGGTFRESDGGPGNGIAKWDGSDWSSLGVGLGLGRSYALAVYDDGTGSALYVGGSIDSAGGIVARSIARWDGSNWSPVGGGIQSTDSHQVRALVVFDDGSGPALYAGGDFEHASGVPAANLARWDGTAWSAVGSGTNGPINALAVFDDGAGPALYAAGPFSQAGAVTASNVAKWDGTSWSALGGGNAPVTYAMSVFDDGSGSALYCGGYFFTVGGTILWNIARWDGQSWSALGAGINPLPGVAVRALATFNSESGMGLYAGGEFMNSAGYLLESSRVAKWRACASPVDTFCFGDGSVAPCPCSHFGLQGRGCENSQSTGGARLDATGTTSPDALVLQATGELPTALTIFLQGDVVAPGSLMFGDGIRCFVGNLKRMYKRPASAGAVAAPAAGDPSITARSAAMGDPIPSGGTRYYMTYYRDPNTSFCRAPQGSTFNSSNAVRVVW